ncbi:MAG: hypothetical protein KI793_29975 [Rivularia sp. (in: Bacteria)]|nr:hypothetical protein [Rivularia sp. MS3]
MTISAAVTYKIKTLNYLRTRCNLYQAEGDRFFTEWIENLAQLNETEKAGRSYQKLIHFNSYSFESGLLS